MPETLDIFAPTHLHQSLRNALWTVVGVIRNALACTLVAWGSNYIWSLGNFFSGLSVSEQSHASFLAGALGSSHSISSAMTVIAQALILRSFRFLGCPDRPPAFGLCVRELMERSGIALGVTLVLMILMVYLVSLDGSLSTRDFKLEFYFACLIGHIFTTSMGISTRQIIKLHTVQGQRALGQQQSRQQQQSPQVSAIAVSSRRTSMCRSCFDLAQLRRFGKIYIRTYDTDVSVIVAGLYVHLSTHFGIPTEALPLFWFTMGSLVLKILAQEGAKWMLASNNIQDIRMMCVAIGLPTILIDTQVRIALQRAQSAKVAVSGTIGLGLIEVGMRIGKVCWLKAQIRRRASCRNASVVPSTQDPLPVSPTTMPKSDSDGADFDAWQRRLWSVHTAELYADMSAEYMAIGCSTSILYFFSNHPKYMLTSNLSSGPSSSTASASHQALVSLGGQVVVETCVDILSCVVEISAGTDFQQLHKYSFFVISLLVNLAVVNVQISGMIYILRSS